MQQEFQCVKSVIVKNFIRHMVWEFSASSKAALNTPRPTEAVFLISTWNSQLNIDIRVGPIYPTFIFSCCIKSSENAVTVGSTNSVKLIVSTPSSLSARLRRKFTGTKLKYSSVVFYFYNTDSLADTRHIQWQCQDRKLADVGCGMVFAVSGEKVGRYMGNH